MDITLFDKYCAKLKIKKNNPRVLCNMYYKYCICQKCFLFLRLHLFLYLLKNAKMVGKYSNRIVYLFCMMIFVMITPAFSQQIKDTSLTIRAEVQLKKWNQVSQLRIDSVYVLKQPKQVKIFFSKGLSFLPVREDNLKDLQKSISAILDKNLKEYKILIFSNGYEYAQLLPNYFNLTLGIDSTRLSRKVNKIKFIKKIGGIEPEKALYYNYIALWHSHGWYYESELDRWEWQRARLFGTVEDISPMAFVLPYLSPMLENAGATVFIPRERDIQISEVIIDNNFSTGKSEFILDTETSILSESEGFIWKDTLFEDENPFKMGTSLLIQTKVSGKVATYLPDIPAKGEYAVYVSYKQHYKDNSDSIIYTIHHSGGATAFLIDQSMGGGTWIYLGTFLFEKGKNLNTGSIEVSCSGDLVSLDAFKLGGGMGNIARRPSKITIPKQRSLKSTNIEKPQEKVNNANAFSWKISGKPRYMEGARYWLQYAGMPDTLVYSLNDGKNDYNDDYQSRGEWINYLKGKPNGPKDHRNLEGLNIPIDLSFAFHTDAGVTPNDSIIGTLGIYSTVRDSGLFPNGQSKLASRDLTDIIQSQVVDDIRKLYNPKWTRRSMWDHEYSEAWRPNVPSMLLELFSHQNLADAKFGLDPRFQFDVSRAIYKGMLRFQATQEGRDYVVQPLPVNYMAINEINDSEYELTWMAVEDSLEISAKPDYYKVYQRIDNHGFDEGVIVENSSFRFTIDSVNQIYSFKVTAVNDGGESFPGEVLSVGVASNSPSTVLVVNAFDRICGPAIVDNGKFAGIAWWEDEGVADKTNIAFTGQQYDFDRESSWLDDDSPGWGASYGDMEGKVIPGNTFDFCYTHGESILAAGYSFISVSDEAFISAKDLNSDKYKIVDIILGEEKTTPRYKNPLESDFKIFTKPFIAKLKQLTDSGTNLLLTGAYVGSDAEITKDSFAIKFASEVLHYKWRTNHATKNGAVSTTDYAKPYFKGNFQFNTIYAPEIYSVEAPDAIEPSGEGAITAWRYKENNTSAGTLYNGKYKTIILGFPFETIIKKEERNELMKAMLSYFSIKNQE